MNNKKKSLCTLYIYECSKSKKNHKTKDSTGKQEETYKNCKQKYKLLCYQNGGEIVNEFCIVLLFKMEKIKIKND